MCSAARVACQPTLNSPIICLWGSTQIFNEDRNIVQPFVQPFAATWRGVRMLLRSEIVSAVLGTAFAIAVVSVCWLLAARQRTERDHSTALTAAKVLLGAVATVLPLGCASLQSRGCCTVHLHVSPEDIIIVTCQRMTIGPCSCPELRE